MTLASLAAAILAAAPAETGDMSLLMPPFPTSMERQAVTSWLTDRARMPQGVPLVIGPDSALAILTDSTADRPRGQHGVTFREEAINAIYVGRNGGRSIQGAADVNCVTGTIRISSLAVYLGSGMQGPRVADFPAQTTWRVPPVDSVLNRVIDVVCDPTAGAAPAQGGAAALSTAPLGPVATAPAASSPPPIPEPAPAPAPPDPPPPPAAPAEPAPTLPSAAATPEPAPQPELRGGVEPGAPAPAAPAPAGRPSSVQIGAFGSSDQAFRALEELASVVPDQLGGKSQEVLPARVNGAQVFRAVVGGFPTRQEAQAFCSALSAAKRGCVVRP